jgi:Flp pilus assembly protein TadD/protein-L-isoaspartate O-methyltransferase
MNHKEEIKKAEELFQEGHVDEAEDIFNCVLQDQPENHEILNNLGVIHFTRGDVEEAEACLLKGLAVKPDYLDALFNLSLLYRRSKHWQAAARQLEKYISISNGNADVLNQLGLIYIEMGNREAAVSLLEKSIQMNPNQQIVKYTLGRLEEIRKQVKRENAEIIKDYAEFSGIPLQELIQRMNRFHELVNEEWNELGPSSWTDRVKMFYARSNHYILDLLYANADRAAAEKKLEKYGIWKFLDQLPPGLDVLEFGGGLGVVCQLFCERDYQVTYLDIPGRPMDFAKWRFQRYHIPVRIIESDPERLTLEDDYDFIFSDAVFEHLIDPCQAAEGLMRHLRPGGYLLLLIDVFNNNDLWPMHRPLDFHALDNTLTNCGGIPERISSNRMMNLWQKR